MFYFTVCRPLRTMYSTERWCAIPGDLPPVMVMKIMRMRSFIESFERIVRAVHNDIRKGDRQALEILDDTNELLSILRTTPL